MAIQIIKAGIMDSFQDSGRKSLAHLGINRSGVMDEYHAAIANALAGNPPHFALLEMGFPAATIRFERNIFFALSGGDFDAHLDGKQLKIHQPAHAKAGSLLVFKNPVSGRWIYLAVKGGFHIEKILGSFSTNLKGRFGGWKGRKLETGDQIELAANHLEEQKPGPNFFIQKSEFETEPVALLPGPEFDVLSGDAKQQLFHSAWNISAGSDRMAYKLVGEILQTTRGGEMLSAPVTRGTVQVLPSGDIMVLMADHQTIGGYPRIGQLTASDFYRFAQWSGKIALQFKKTTMDEALRKYKDEQAKINKRLAAIKLHLHCNQSSFDE